MNDNISAINNIRLYPIKEADIQIIRNIRNMDRNRLWFVYQEIISESEQIAWYKKYENKTDDYMFVAYSDTDAIVGAVALYEMNKKTKTCEFGRIMTTIKGVGNKIANAALKIAFEQMLLEKVVLEVFEQNILAIRLYKRMGFVELERENGIIKMCIDQKIYYQNRRK